MENTKSNYNFKNWGECINQLRTDLNIPVITLCLLRSTVRADTRISYYLRILDYLHDFVIEEEDFRKAWLKLGGY